MTRTAIIAGEGRLAPILAGRLPEAPVFTLHGIAPDLPAQSFRLERLVPFLDHLLDEGVTRVTFAGAIRRPSLDPEMFDPRTAALVPRILAAIGSGDDAALRIVIEIFEEFGLNVLGVADIAADLIPGEGVLLGEPLSVDKADAIRAATILQATGPLDLGQGIVVAKGLCLALETLPGTAAMLEFAASHQALRTGKARGVFYKAPKPGQDLRIDLPTIGPDTVDQAAKAGLAGIAWQAGGVILLEKEESMRRAADAGLFLWSRAG